MSRRELLYTVIAGAVARLVAAVVGIGFHARDDYFHVLAPALRFAEDPSFDWDDSGMPGAGLRSHLVPRLIAFLIRGFHAIDVTSPENLLRGIYIVLGLLSLLTIPLLAALAQRHFDATTARYAAWLGALYFALPYVGTKLFIEALAIVPLLCGFWFAGNRDLRSLFLSGLCVGLAGWFRYQVGAAGIGLWGVVVYQQARSEGASRALQAGALMGTGALVAFGIQGAYDLATAGGFLKPLLANLAYNLEPPGSLTRSNPFSYVGLWLLLTVPPLSLWLVPAMFRAARAAPLIGIPFGLFVLLHSFVPHKEERFMIPVLPLFVLLLAAAPLAWSGWENRYANTLRRFDGWAWKFFVGLHAIALMIAVTAESQKNHRQVYTALHQDEEAVAFLSMGPEVQEFYLGRRQLPHARIAHPDMRWFHERLAEFAQREVPVNRIVVFEDNSAAMNIMLMERGLLCQTPQRFEGYWLDRLVRKLNPKHNRRRQAILLYGCKAPQVAMR